MRQILFRIPWDGFSVGGMTIPLFGFGLLFWLVIAGAVWLVVQEYRKPIEERGQVDVLSIFFWIGLLGAIVMAPDFGPKMAPQGIPIFGYGTMLLLGMVSALWLAARRAEQQGLPSETIPELLAWLFIPGMIGARLFYLVQYHEQVYAQAISWPQKLVTTIAVWEGGLVLYGGLLAGAAGYFAFCYARKIRPLVLADIITPSVFVGIGFGRLGCLMNGCCFGDLCTLPWGLEFPAGSGPFQILVQRGFLSPDALSTPPLHPTQIYSSLDGFLTAAVCYAYFPYRRLPGDVLALALIICPINRFLIEFLRGDEFGQLGTTLTISQWISLGLLAAGISLQCYLTWKSRNNSHHHPVSLTPADAR